MKIKINRPDTTAKPKVEPGRHIARIVQIANTGLQRPFQADEPPQPRLGVAFELACGTIMGRTFAVSGSIFSLLGELIDAAGLTVGDEVTADQLLDVDRLLDKQVAIEVERNDRGYLRLVEFAALEEFEDPIEGSAELLSFDIDNLPKDKAEANRILRALHGDIRQAISRRVKVVADAET